MERRVFSKIVETMQKITDYVLHYDEVETRAEYSNQSTADGIRSFEGLTNDRALYPEDRNSYIRGWYVSFKENVAYVAITDADQNIIQKAVLKASEDVAGYLGEKKFRLQKNVDLKKSYQNQIIQVKCILHRLQRKIK